MNIKDCRGDFSQPLTIRNVTSISADQLAANIEFYASEQGIPAKVSVQSIHSGGFLFGSDYPCVMVSHPNPPQRYFDLLFIINQNTISFKYWGESKANTSANKKEYYKNQGTIGGGFKSLFYSNDEMALQTEGAWQHSILSIVCGKIYSME